MDQGSRINDLGPRTLDLGPCFGMNGHFRSDLDVISRLPESTIDFLSFYTCLGSLNSVTIMFLDENIGFV